MSLTVKENEQDKLNERDLWEPWEEEPEIWTDYGCV
jgi:hypothetical protein